MSKRESYKGYLIYLEVWRSYYKSMESLIYALDDNGWIDAENF